MSGTQGVDTLALSWCLPEIVESAARVSEALDRHLAAEPGTVAELKVARIHLHQVHGALQVAGLPGVNVVIEEAEGFIDRGEQGSVPIDAVAIDAIKRTVNASVEYLQDVQAGSPLPPVVLFPYYRKLLELRKAERIDPADLYFPDLSIAAPPAQGAPYTDPRGPALLLRARVEFERGLLGFLRSAAIDPAAMKSMDAALTLILKVSGNRAGRTFFWLAHAVIDALKHQALPNDLYVKRLLARVNIQARRILEKHDPVADRILKDLLFQLARAQDAGPMAVQARRHFQVAGTVPADFERPRYGLIDPAWMKKSRDALVLLKRHWEKLVQGAAGELAPVGEASVALQDGLRAMPFEGMRVLAGVLAQVPAAAARLGAGVAEHPLAIEVATTVLFIEEALEHGLRQDPAYDGRARQLAQRLELVMNDPAAVGDDLPDWLVELSNQASERITIGTFASELSSNLRQCEQALDGWFRKPEDTSALAGILPLLRQSLGVLRSIGADQPALACEAVRDDVSAILDGSLSPTEQDQLRIANNLSALGFFVDSLAQPESLRDTFEFDATTRELVARMSADRFRLESRLHAALDGLNAGDGAGASAEARLRARRSALLPWFESIRTDAGSAQAAAALASLLAELEQDAILVDDTELKAAVGRARSAVDGVRAGTPGAIETLVPLMAGACGLPAARAAAQRLLAALAAGETAWPAQVAAQCRADAEAAAAAAGVAAASAAVAAEAPVAASAAAEDEAGAHVPAAATAAVADEASAPVQAAASAGASAAGSVSHAFVAPVADVDAPVADVASPVAAVAAPVAAAPAAVAPVAAAPASAVAPAVQPASAVAPAPAPVARTPRELSDDERELHEIFLLEAAEVLDAIGGAMGELRASPSNQDHLTTVRRAFHTLKGSSRMVGLDAFGSVGWAFEQLLNAWLSDAKSADDAFFALVDDGHALFTGWVGDLQTDPDAVRDAQWLIARCEALREGRDEPAAVAAPVAVAPVAVDAVAVEAAPVEAAPVEALSVEAVSVEAVGVEPVGVDAAGDEAVAVTDVEAFADVEAVAHVDAVEHDDALADVDAIGHADALAYVEAVEHDDAFADVEASAHADAAAIATADFEPAGVPLPEASLIDDLDAPLLDDLLDFDAPVPDDAPVLVDMMPADVIAVDAMPADAGAFGADAFDADAFDSDAFNAVASDAVASDAGRDARSDASAAHEAAPVADPLAEHERGGDASDASRLDALARAFGVEQAPSFDFVDTVALIAAADALDQALEPGALAGDAPDAAAVDADDPMARALDALPDPLGAFEHPVAEPAHAEAEAGWAEAEAEAEPAHAEADAGWDEAQAPHVEATHDEATHDEAEAAPIASSNDDELLIGGVRPVNRQLFAVFVAEARDIAERIASHFDLWLWTDQPAAAPHELVRALHSLVGASRHLGLTQVREMALPAERFLENHAQTGAIVPTADFETFDRAMRSLCAMLAAFERAEEPMADPAGVIALEALAERWADPAFWTAHLPAEPAPVATATLHDGHDTDAALQGHDGDAPRAGEDARAFVDADDAYFVDADPVPVPASGEPSQAATAQADAEPVLEYGPPVVSWARSQGVPVVVEPVVVEPVVTEPVAAAAVTAAAAPAGAAAAGDEPVARMPSVQAPVAQATVVAAPAQAAAAAVPPASAAPVTARPRPVVVAADEGEDPYAAFVDDIDADLGPVFFEEADEQLESIGTTLRDWQQDPSNGQAPAQMMRLLHTVKGGARMAGAMQLGQRLHDMESLIEEAVAQQRVDAELVESLQASHDTVMARYDALHRRFHGLPVDAAPVAAAPAAPAVRSWAATGEIDRSAAAQAATAAAADAAAGGAASTVAAGAVAASPSASVAAAGDAAVAATRTAQGIAAVNAAMQMIRVRSDQIDRMVAEAGEVSVARARLESEHTQIRQAMAELAENVSRLRSQLREIEIQADTQIQAQIAQSKDNSEQFDPLEYDRYTRFQELTRMLAESVNDVATIQQNAMRAVDSAHQDLSRQTQVSRSLQHGLMRVRMVQFGTVSDRLYRVVRQAAKDTEKRVALEIHGASAEVDRGVLDRMTGPIEHLLRNSVAHGIESREQRLAAGKPEKGELTVELRVDGNEIVMRFTDDGAGLNYARIEQRGREKGLIAANRTPTEQELAALIFAPGFSTVEQSAVTTIAGRGVGMDVVRAEVSAMGGRIDIESVVGRGTTFTVHLPASLAISHVALMGVGDVRYAVQAALVERIMQVRQETLVGAYAARSIEVDGQSIPLHFLGDLLDLHDVRPVPARQSPVMVVRSGPNRIALHVDTVVPNQEAVIKPVGPQLARMSGISGATVLGNGDIVLILNPAQLAEHATVGRQVSIETVEAMSTESRAETVVMVVDDSVTVRKVTQRLLTREGYTVLLAKDGVDALRQLQDETPDIMLVDIEMPRMDGFDLTKNIRASELWADIPIVMITSRTADKHRNHALSLGVDAFLGKPFVEQELLNQIEQLTHREPARA